MTTRPRIALGVSTAVLSVALLVAAGGYWVFYTQPGAKWGFERLGAIMPGKLEVDEMHGPLRGPLEIRGLRYRSDRVEISAAHVLLDWRLRELLRRKLDIYRLRADTVRVLVGMPSDTTGPLPDTDLPVAIIVREGLVNQIRITRSPRDSGLVLDRVFVDARSVRHDSLYVNRLVVESRPLDLEFSGAARPRGAYPVHLRGRWTYRAPGRAPITGQGTLAGTMDTLGIEQDLAGPFSARLDGRLIRPLRAMRYEGTVAFSRVTPREFDAALPQGTYAGRASVIGNLDQFRTQGSLSGTTRALGVVAADFRVGRDRNLWNIEDLLLTRPGRPGRFSARGTATTDGRTPRFDLQTEWAAMGWPLTGEPWVESERGTARIHGTARDFGIKLKALVAGRDLPPGNWTLDGRGGNGRLAIRTVIADILDGRIVGSGTVGWQPAIRWNLRFDGNGINPGTVWPAYPGSLAFSGTSRGTKGRSSPSGRLLVSRLSGTLRDQPISGGGTLDAAGGQYTLSAATVQWGPNRAQANGGFGKKWNLSWNVDAPRIGAVLAQASGSAKSQGTIRGSSARPHLTGTVTGDSLFLGTFHAAALRADGDLDLGQGGVIRLDATATRLNAGTHAADRAILSARGTRERNEIRASVAGRGDSTVTLLMGGFGRDGWRGTIQTLTSVHPRAGSWSLAQPARLSASTRRVEVAGFVWESGVQRISLDATWQRRGPWSFDSRIENVQLSSLEPFLPPRLRLQGPLRGRITAHAGPDGRVFANADIVPGPGEILHNTATGQWVATRFENGLLRATADGNRTQAMFRADLVGNGTIRAELGWPAYGAALPSPRQRVDGTLAIHLRDIAMLQGFTNELDATSGALDADLAIGGTAEYPYLHGPLHLRNGSADVPRFGLELREANLQATGSSGGKLAVEGSIRSGEGTLGIHGTAALSGAKPTATFTVSGKRVQAMNTHDAKFVASPDLRFDLDGRRLEITGDVVIPEGRIGVGREDEKRLVKVSEDVVYRGADTLSVSALEVHSRVRVTLEDKVLVRGYGLEVYPKGTVMAIDAPGLPTLGRGQLDVKNGTYRIYGGEFAIESGALIFGGGPITNPAVRARAVREASDGIKAGFIVGGTVMKPDVQVFSEPAMGQTQALSYVLFGKPIERTNLSEGQMASTMAQTLGVPGTNFLAHGLASEVGIEKARIEVGNSFKNTALSLGTHISPKLYIGYGMDVFDATSSLKLKYILNRVFTIEAETAQQNRVDVMYTVER